MTVTTLAFFLGSLVLTGAQVDVEHVACTDGVCANEIGLQLVQKKAFRKQEGADDLPSFASFIQQHRRVYAQDSEEYQARRALFEKRVAEVKRHNSQPNQPWRAVVNHLSDRTEGELAQLLGWKGFANDGRSVGNIASHQHSTSKLSLGQHGKAVVPDNHTWAHLKAIKADVNQGACGSCWAVATSTMMTAADEIAGNNRRFSAQDLVNCVPNPHNCGGNGGCKGSTVELAMNFIATNGLRSADSSPYFGRDARCYLGHSKAAQLSDANGVDTIVTPRFDDVKSSGDFKYGSELDAMIAIGQHNVHAGSPGATLGLKHWTRLPENEYSPLLSHLVQYGPLAVSVSAAGWYAYGEGIFNSCIVDAVINHAVVLFGYGADADLGNLKYWDIKNSWGNYWGSNGNIRLLREDTVRCGVDRQPEVGTGCDGGPKEVKVCGTCGILYDVVSVSMDRK